MKLDVDVRVTPKQMPDGSCSMGAVWHRHYYRCASMHAQCYNPPFPRILRFRMSSRGQRVFLVLFPAIVLLLTIPASAQQWDLPARELAGKIITRAQSRSAVSLEIRNISSLTQSQVLQVQRALESQLGVAGVRLVSPEQAVDEAKVTLSENTAGYLWIAEVGHGDSWDIVMLAVPFGAPTDRAPAGLVLRRVPLWSDREPVLDVASIGDDARLVLGRDVISFYRREDGKWQSAGSAALTRSRPWPRDLRGRILLQPGGSFRVFLPGVQCAGTVQPQLNITCQENDDPWPLAPDVYAFFASHRNFFTGAVKLAQSSEAGDLGPFYSAALYAQADRGFWIVASTNGGARLINAKGQVVTAFPGWGSDLVGLVSDCGSKWQVLATRAGDNTVADSLQAYDIANVDAVEAGSSLEFAGPIMALWSANDAHSATVISHNLKTGSYEAFSISAVCGR